MRLETPHKEVGGRGTRPLGGPRASGEKGGRDLIMGFWRRDAGGSMGVSLIRQAKISRIFSLQFRKF